MVFSGTLVNCGLGAVPCFSGMSRKDAASIGPATAALCDLILDERVHPEQGFRACLGIIRLARSYGHERLDAAATRAIDIGARTYGSIASILKTGLDRAFHDETAADAAPLLHANIRGRTYYH